MVPLFLLLLASAVAAKVEEQSAIQLKGIAKINPKLEPKSDKKFFGKQGNPGDYPTDTGRGIKDHFDFPFPTVQDSEDYDHDIVKDENHDGGEWKAHQQYDRLRGKLQSEHEDVKAAQTKVEEAHKKYEAAKAKEEAAKQAVDGHETNVDAAKAKEKEAEAKLAKIGAASGEGSEKADAEVTDLEDCKSKLQEARERLRKLLAEREARKAEKDAAVDDVKEAEAASVASEQTEAELAETLAQEKKDHAIAETKYEQEKKDYDTAQKKLDLAAEKLRKHRRDSVDQNQGVYYNPDPSKKTPPKSGAMSTGPALLLVAMAALVSA